MALTVFKQILLNFNTFNHFQVVKCLQMTKTKHLHKVKQNWKKAIFCLLFCDFFERGYHKTKSEYAHEITQIIQSQKLNDEDIYLTMV